MSTVMSILRADRVEVLSDAGHWHHETGELIHVASKIQDVPGGVLIGQGTYGISLYVAEALQARRDFDEVIAALPETVTDAEARLQVEIGDLARNYRLFLAGWSASRGRPERHLICGPAVSEDVDPHAAYDVSDLCRGPFYGLGPELDRWPVHGGRQPALA
jgi:hypothetical protein